MNVRRHAWRHAQRHARRHALQVITGLGLAALLSGCNLSQSEESPRPTVDNNTPVAWATAPTGLPDAESSENSENVQADTPLPSVTPAPTLTAESDHGATPITGAPTGATPTETTTAPASFTPAGLHPTGAPTLTNTPFPAQDSAAGIGGAAASDNVAVAAVASNTPFYSQPPTFTPVFIVQTPISPTPAPAGAAVCSSCGGLRLRGTPGTAGDILTTLDANAPLTIIGRTADNIWLQVTTADGTRGWVAANYLVLTIDLNTVEVTGAAVEAPTAAPAATIPGGSSDGLAIVSGVSAHARQIFLDGQAKGNRPNVFSKVGDSITFAPYFMHQLASNYDLGDYSHLQPAVNYFSGPNARGENSFSAASLAAMPGWSTVTQLTPGKSGSPLCGGDETPLVCEYRTAKPSVALIMLGTIDSEGFITLDQYRANLERVVQITIDMGIVPVLSTIPPLQVEEERNQRGRDINQIIIATARAYDIPLWNYYGAMINLPNKGLSGDGGHPSEPPDGQHAIFDANHLQYGYPMRNLTALQMLYELWRQVMYDGGAGATTQIEDTDTGAVGPTDLSTYACPGAPAVRLAVGGQGRVTPGLPNKLRNVPSLSGGTIGSIPGEGVFSVVGGPRCADGFTWWQVTYNGITGWTASGDSSEYWIEPLP
ncbi:MAG: SH3 domain-containing protein [Anaerolineae bacterium]|nr:SH3 domain-containing protein [Anaerolineae bacterium]